MLANGNFVGNIEDVADSVRVLFVVAQLTATVIAKPEMVEAQSNPLTLDFQSLVHVAY